MKLYKNGNGWKAPNKKTGQSWTYYENGKVKVPGSDAIRALQIGLDKGKELYKSIRDMPIRKILVDGFNSAAKYHGEAGVLRGEIAVEQGRQLVEAGDKLVDVTENIITETSKIPDRWSFHPNCMETFGELCTYNEYNQRMLQRVREEEDGWATYLPGSGGID